MTFQMFCELTVLALDRSRIHNGTYATRSTNYREVIFQYSRGRIPLGNLQAYSKYP